MIVTMQGNWAVAVHSKSAAFEQRFIVSGADSGNGTYAGVTSTPAVHVQGSQWSIAIQNNPGSGWQLSSTQIKFPHIVGGNYRFEIWSNDAGGDEDFNDLILTCSTPVNINDFIIYGSVSLYSGICLLNPCWHGPYVIDTMPALVEAIKNPRLRDILEKLYPERIREIIIDPNPPDPPPFRPMVIDLNNYFAQPKKSLLYKRMERAEVKASEKAKKEISAPDYSVNNYTFVKSTEARSLLASNLSIAKEVELAHSIESLFHACHIESGTNVTLTFEEYDRTSAELAGGPYTGEGDRRLLGDAITDMFGNYIFRFSFDMTFPGIEDSTDIAPGEAIDVVAYPDVIVKVNGLLPTDVYYESAPYNNIPNLKRINLCLPESIVHPTQVCFNGNLIGSLGNVFLGGNQNNSASFSNTALRRYGYSNYLEADGKITVGSSLAGFSIDCASWRGVIDMKGCMYDTSKSASENTIKWYTIRIKRAGTNDWNFVSQNYKHPRYSNRNIPNYIGDDVGPFTTSLHIDGGAAQSEPAYKNIQREMFVDGIDWEFSNIDRYMQLNTALYDLVAGVRTTGTYYVRVDGYNDAGQPVGNATDMIALYIHNLSLGFSLTSPSFLDASIYSAGCGLYKLTDAQMNSPMHISFKANDPYGFVHSFLLSMGRCPAPMIGLQLNNHKPPLADTLSGDTTFAVGGASGNTHDNSNPDDSCPGFTGTTQVFSDSGMIDVEFQPAASEGGWIKPTETFTVISFTLTAYKRETNGYNTGVSDQYYRYASIYLERIS